MGLKARDCVFGVFGHDDPHGSYTCVVQVCRMGHSEWGPSLTVFLRQNDVSRMSSEWTRVEDSQGTSGLSRPVSEVRQLTFPYLVSYLSFFPVSFSFLLEVNL